MALGIAKSTPAISMLEEHNVDPSKYKGTKSNS